MGSPLLKKRIRRVGAAMPEILSPGGKRLGDDFVELDEESLPPDSLIAEAFHNRAYTVATFRGIFDNSDNDAPLVIVNREGRVLPIKVSFVADEDVRGRTVYFPKIVLNI